MICPTAVWGLDDGSEWLRIRVCVAESRFGLTFSILPLGCRLAAYFSMTITQSS